MQWTAGTRGKEAARFFLPRIQSTDLPESYDAILAGSNIISRFITLTISSHSLVLQTSASALSLLPAPKGDEPARHLKSPMRPMHAYVSASSNILYMTDSTHLICIYLRYIIMDSTVHVDATCWSPWGMAGACKGGHGRARRTYPLSTCM